MRAWAVMPSCAPAAELDRVQADRQRRQPPTIRFDADAGELKGPLDFGFALSRLSPSPDKSEQRAVVIGDGDFLSNTFLGNGGNRALGERVFDWLLGDDKLVDLPPRGAPDRLLDHFAGRTERAEFRLPARAAAAAAADRRRDRVASAPALTMKRAARQRLGILLSPCWRCSRWRAGSGNATRATHTAADRAGAGSISRIALRSAARPPCITKSATATGGSTDGAAARADDGRLAELADTAAAPVLSWRPASDFEPAKIGLTPPQAVLAWTAKRSSSAKPPVPGRSATCASASASHWSTRATCRARRDRHRASRRR